VGRSVRKERWANSAKGPRSVEVTESTTNGVSDGSRRSVIPGCAFKLQSHLDKTLDDHEHGVQVRRDVVANLMK
jgi:hypothetical protein